MPTPPNNTRRDLERKLRTYIQLLAQVSQAITLAAPGSDELTFLQTQSTQVQATITDLQAQLAAL